MNGESKEILICSTGCPCRYEVICLKAGLKNGLEFGRNLKKAINERRQFEENQKDEQLKQSQGEN